MLTLSSVSPVLAGRSCLCVALSHHLFLARLLISVLIISCSPLSVWVGCTHLVSRLFPILIPYYLSSIHPSLQTACHQSSTQKINFCVLFNNMGRARLPSCTHILDATVLSLLSHHSGQEYKNTNSPSALLILRAFQSHTRPLVTGVPKKISVYLILRTKQRNHHFQFLVSRQILFHR